MLDKIEDDQNWYWYKSATPVKCIKDKMLGQQLLLLKIAFY